jgi:tetratricopeptide (TPR) repeat protein
LIFFISVAHLNLALSYAELNRKDEALNILLNIPKISDDGTKDPRSHLTTQVSALFNAGRILLDMGRPVKALRVLQEAEERGRKIQFSSQQGILNLLGEAHQAANNTQEAERWYRAALTAKPDHIPAYLTYGKMLAKNVSKGFM